MKIRTKADAVAFRNQILTAAAVIDDKGASMVLDFYSDLKYLGGLVLAGTRINHNGVLYKAAVDLWDREDNNPDNAPNLWAEIEYINGVRKIPNAGNGSFDVARAFAKDELGYFEADGKVYKSLLDANVYTPAAYPQGWKEIE